MITHSYTKAMDIICLLAIAWCILDRYTTTDLDWSFWRENKMW